MTHDRQGNMATGTAGGQAATPGGTVILTMWRVVEQFLKEDADMECVRQFSRFPVAASILMMSFQAISAIMMINMFS